VKGVLFDLDETLIDRRRSLDRYARALRGAYRGRFAEDEFVAHFHRLDGAGRVPRRQFFAEIARELFDDATADAIEAHFYTHAWRAPLLHDGMAAILRDVRARGWRSGIITNGGVVAQSAKIDNSGLRESVDGAVISDAFGAKKPDPAIFLNLIDTLGIDPAQSWFVGDDPTADVWGAKQVGLRACWIERHAAWPDELPRCYDARVTDAGQLRAVLFG